MKSEGGRIGPRARAGQMCDWGKKRSETPGECFSNVFFDTYTKFKVVDILFWQVGSGGGVFQKEKRCSFGWAQGRFFRQRRGEMNGAWSIITDWLSR